MSTIPTVGIFSFLASLGDYVNYDEVFDIMECANNRILNLIAVKENPMEWLMYVMKVATDYKERLHLVLAPQEQYRCNCVDSHYE